MQYVERDSKLNLGGELRNEYFSVSKFRHKHIMSLQPMYCQQTTSRHMASRVYAWVFLSLLQSIVRSWWIRRLIAFE